MQLRNANLKLQLELAKIKQAARLASKPVAEPTLEPVPEPAPTSQSPEDMGLNASGGNKKDPQATESATEPNVSGGNKEDLQEAKQAAKLAAELAPETNRPAKQLANAAHTAAAAYITIKATSTEAYTVAAGGGIMNIQWNMDMGIYGIYNQRDPQIFDIIGIG